LGSKFVFDLRSGAQLGQGRSNVSVCQMQLS